MNQNNVSDYVALAEDYRQKQKKLFRESVSSNKKVIYWANEAIDLTMDDEDLVQWWGISEHKSALSGRKNKVILSNYDQTYLDGGFGNIYGNNYLIYQSWRKLYEFDPVVTNATVFGGEVCMWNKLGVKQTFDQKVVQRASVLAERLWNTGVNLNEELLNIATRLQSHMKRMKGRGFKVWPVTV